MRRGRGRGRSGRLKRERQRRSSFFPRLKRVKKNEEKKNSRRCSLSHSKITGLTSIHEREFSRPRLFLREGFFDSTNSVQSLSLSTHSLGFPVDGARPLGPLRRRCGGGRRRRSGDGDDDDDERRRRRQRQRKLRRWSSPGLVRRRVREPCSRCVENVKELATPWRRGRDQLKR